MCEELDDANAKLTSVVEGLLQDTLKIHSG
jgi:hypothetical protein